MNRRVFLESNYFLLVPIAFSLAHHFRKKLQRRGFQVLAQMLDGRGSANDQNLRRMR